MCALQNVMNVWAHFIGFCPGQKMHKNVPQFIITLCRNCQIFIIEEIFSSFVIVCIFIYPILIGILNYEIFIAHAFLPGMKTQLNASKRSCHSLHHARHTTMYSCLSSHLGYRPRRDRHLSG